MFEFFHDLLHDKETFIITVIVPTLVIVVFSVIIRITNINIFEERLKRLEKMNGIKNEIK